MWSYEQLVVAYYIVSVALSVVLSVLITLGMKFSIEKTARIESRPKKSTKKCDCLKNLNGSEELRIRIKRDELFTDLISGKFDIK